ncbi:MAG TPA: hypothetical protein VMU82_16645, partial [Acetobacteraceae bacterium]|nr:hypothetical protein [Acetobacteraceae bacterium]
MIGRRALLAAAVLRPGWPDLGARTFATLRARLAALPAGPALLRSYDVRHGAHETDFDRTNAVCAYVYDNALAGHALLAAGDRAGAMRIGQALAIAQRNDRFYHDGRLRNAYAAGPMTRPAKLPGWWDVQAKRWAEDPYQAGTAAGVVAWAMLLWLALDDAKLRAAAVLAAGWVEANLRGPHGY